MDEEMERWMDGREGRRKQGREGQKKDEWMYFKPPKAHR